MLRPSLLAFGPLALACAISAVAACGDDPVVVNPLADAGPPVAAPYGLDVRPKNDTCKAPPKPEYDTGVTFEPAFDGVTFAAPTGFRMAPGDANTFYVIERSGNIVAIKRGETTKRPFFTFPNGVINAAGEGGFLAFAFHPKWPATPEAFLSYTTFSTESPVNMRSVVARVSSKDGGITLDPSTLDEVFTVQQPYTNHNGGDLSFGPDGFLYYGLGDGGSANDPKKAGQDKNQHLGKMLRFDVSGVEGNKKYKIPTTNPYAAGGGLPEIYALGFRNPWRWSFDMQSGDLWVGDVGQNTWEEVDLVKLGGNYGWSTREGRHCFQPATGCVTTGLIDPIAEHPRSEAQSITGGYVYRGTSIPALVGKFIYGDYATGNVWAVQDEGEGKGTPLKLGSITGGLASFGQDAAGEVYALLIAKGTIMALRPSKPPPPSTFPQLLSKTGCVDPSDAKKPAAGLIGFEPNSPLWSDGARKERFMALPTGGRISVNAAGDWDYPNGTVLIKTFFLDDKRVETRLFMRHDDGEWAGYSYEWNEAQTDATLLSGSKTKPFGSHEWTFPSGAQCMQCHTERAGFSLGLETAQLNRDFVYPQTNRISNQLKTLDHIGLFEQPLFEGDVAPSALPRYPDPLSAEGTEESRARSYLHSNCSHCHRPPAGRTEIDLRFSTAISKMQACNVVSQLDDFGLADSKILKPGDPSKSILSLRIHATDARRMPVIGSKVVDEKGVAVVDAWIKGITSCN